MKFKNKYAVEVDVFYQSNVDHKSYEIEADTEEDAESGILNHIVTKFGKDSLNPFTLGSLKISEVKNDE